MSKKAELVVAGRKMPVSNLDKVLFPATGFTKGDLIHYYVEISGMRLPHLKKRPVTLKRYPDGVEGFFFYERHCPAHKPAWVKTARAERHEKGGDIDYCVLGDLPSLVWAANLANIEIHTFLHLGAALERPRAVAFDLDPGAPADVVDCCRVALWMKEIFDALKLQSFAKTSGSKGLQVFVPLNSAVTYERTKAFSKTLAEYLEREHGGFVVSKMQKSLRKGKVLIDWSQNDDHKTTVCVYSVRAKEHPTVSTPLEWREVELALKKKDAARLKFETADVLKRVKKQGDLFAPVLALKQKLPALAKLGA